MGLLENVNKGHRSTVGIETDHNVRYIKLMDYIKEIGSDRFKFYGFIVSESKRFGGKQVVLVVSPDTFVNIPKRYAELFDDVTDDELKLIFDGKMEICDVHEISSKNGKTATFNLHIL